MTTPPPLLAARGLRFARNEQPVFGPLAFSVDAGDIEIDGRPAVPALRARAIAYLGHLPALKGDLTALAALRVMEEVAKRA